MIPNLSKDMIDVMQQLRKRLRSEFGVDLKLSQTDIIQLILKYVSESHDQRTQLLFADLEDMMGLELLHKSEPEVEDKQTAKRVYRGQVIPDPMPAAHKDSRPKRVYRGQIVA